VEPVPEGKLSVPSLASTATHYRLIAIMLGRLEMTVEECIDHYIAFSKRVFQKKHMFKINMRGRIQARFSTAELEEAIKEIIKSSAVVLEEDTGINARMRREPPSGCKTYVTEQTMTCLLGSKITSSSFVVALSGEIGDHHVVFSSYGRPGEANRTMHDKAKIWEAARATSAASSFFNPISIGNPPQTFLDGAVGRNNPVTVLWDEAKRIWPPLVNETMDSSVDCVVSIGTGVPSAEAFGENLIQVYHTLKAAATETERTAKQFVQDHGDLVRRNGYYRLNVTQGLQTIGLDEADKAGAITAATASYGDDPNVQLLLKDFAEVSRASSAPTANSNSTQRKTSVDSEL
jgi:Patatin-like phospholipase